MIICVKNAEDSEPAKEKFLRAMADFSGAPLSQEEMEALLSEAE